MPNYSGTFAQSARPESSFTLPVGSVIPMTMASSAGLLPLGHLICNGQALLRASYPALFALIGTSCGDGTTTPSAGATVSSGFAAGTAFNLPDLRGRFIRGNDTMFTAPGRANRDTAQTAARVTISNGAPALVTHNNHNLTDNEPITFNCGNPNAAPAATTATPGTLPSPLGIGTQYYVKYVSKDTYQIRSTPNGAAINTTTAGTASTFWALPNNSRSPNMVGGNTQYNPGTVQQDAFQSHWHYMAIVECNGGEGSGGFAGWLSDEFHWQFQGRDMLTDGAHGTPRVSVETRPVNTTVIYIIRAF